MNEKEIWTAMKDMINTMAYIIVIIVLMVLSIPAIIFTSVVEALSNLANWLDPRKRENRKEESY